MARILVIRQGYLPFDPRVWRALEALVGEGHHVDVICKRLTGQPALHEVPGLRIHRLRSTSRKGGKLHYVLQYATFMFKAGWLAARLTVRCPYDLVQVHSLPDTLVFAALVPRLMGARVLLDLQEPMPEFMASKFGAPMEQRGVRMVGSLEQLAIRFADHVLTCTDEMRAVFLRRGAPPEKISVILNSADEEIFDPARFPPRPRTPGRFELVCHGTIEERYGHDLVVRAMAQLTDEIPELRLSVFGDGSYKPVLRDLIRTLGLEERVWFSDGFVPIEEMLAGIAEADVGVVAMQRDVFRDLTHCNKMFDFIIMRRPQIVSRTAAVQSYFDEDCFEMFTAGDVVDLACAIRRLYHSPTRCEQLVDRALKSNEPYRWTRQRQVYLSVVRGLVPRSRDRDRGWKRTGVRPEERPQASDPAEDDVAAVYGAGRSSWRGRPDRPRPKDI
ncbi:MAG: glycosyltransferase family 4 protein [Candidatus Dormibacteraeota bacterium]|jgi:glycosyltransferase involved in cell wall biosynthesis|nr:glycosyltransferase family 4 protein [Candidatus Dormibacteraeota bacterium]